ncbi:MAG: AIR synthase-related protein, partial [Pseudomonadales bacterium]|nr:AIR synthase-related protein [Pseudomonadales bacterium]
LSHYYADTYPESFDSSLPKNLTYCGPYKLDHALPGSEQTVGQALLSPTRSYAPVILNLLNLMKSEINAIVHCSGGAQTKCLRFGQGIHFVKNNLMTVPAVFNAIQTASGTTMKEMYKVFNMGHRMELYVPHRRVHEVIDVATAFGINAQQIGHTEAASENHLSLVDHLGKTIHYP